MRGPSKSLPKYRKHRASGQAIVTLSGKDFYLGPHGTKASKTEYDRLIGEWLANGRQLPSSSDDQSITVVELIAQYWRHCKTYYVKNGKPTDEQVGVRAAMKHLKSVYSKFCTNGWPRGTILLYASRMMYVSVCSMCMNQIFDCR